MTVTLGDVTRKKEKPEPTAEQRAAEELVHQAREHRLQGDREPDDHQVKCHSYPSEPARSERRGLPCRHAPVPLRPLLIASGAPNLVTSGPHANSHRLMRRTHTACASAAASRGYQTQPAGWPAR